MSSIQIKKMNWYKAASAWDQAQRWKAKRAEMRASFEQSSNDFINRFTTAQVNQISGAVDNAAKTLTTRIQRELDAKIKDITASRTNILA